MEESDSYGMADDCRETMRVDRAVLGMVLRLFLLDGGIGLVVPTFHPTLVAGMTAVGGRCKADVDDKSRFGNRRTAYLALDMMDGWMDGWNAFRQSETVRERHERCVCGCFEWDGLWVNHLFVVDTVVYLELSTVGKQCSDRLTGCVSIKIQIHSDRERARE